MGTAIPKQFLPLKGKPVVYYAIKAFLDALPGIKIILVLPEEHISYAQFIVQALNNETDLTIVAGGATRFHSVQNGLKIVAPDEIVFIHDGVRPFVNKELIDRCYQKAMQEGNAIPAVPVTDSVRQWDGSRYVSVDRSLLRSVQTPQTFRSSLIKEAYQQNYNELFTDEATVAEAWGMNIHLVEGLKENIKITSPEDLDFAEARMNKQ